jgi:hypothetical protein
MYRIEKSRNNVIKLEKRLFKELKIREREHLQEWIAKNPEMLEEKLLIIQKEYDGFNDTKERLDLLALDKDGGLVIIENKLDDTGTNVVWQALKYASYCSTLTTNQVIKIYQEYLNKTSAEGDAKENILEFLNRDTEELLLNRGDQRIFFVANNYRKEVTSTVLWLLNHDIKIHCFRATPYSMGEEMFLQIEQIIPLPETKEFMIDAKEKEKEEKSISKTVEDSEARLIKFWGLLKNELKNNNIDFLDRVGANSNSYIGFSAGSGKFTFCIGRGTFRVELYFTNDSDKVLIDAMAKYKDEIDKKHDGLITWERLEGKKASRVKHEMTKEEVDKLEGSFMDELYWDDLVKWYTKAMVDFYKVLYPHWSKVQTEI